MHILPSSTSAPVKACQLTTFSASSLLIIEIEKTDLIRGRWRLCYTLTTLNVTVFCGISLDETSNE